VASGTGTRNGTRRCALSVKGPWAKHFQIDWDNRAANHNLPLWLRVVCLAYGRHEANGHANFQRGELSVILGTPPNGQNPFKRADRTHIRNAIAAAVRHGWLAEGSCSECLVVPGHAIEKNWGNPHAPCPVHERKVAQKRSSTARLTLVS
jgi:hypothetical protein